jgi:hypothetical protein
MNMVIKYNSRIRLFGLIIFLIIFSSTIVASKISRITLAELQEKTDLIVLAEVTEVVNDGNQDQVTIYADSFLKGESSNNKFTFTLVTRGGLKDFDPALEVGETGVFFLKQKELEYNFENTNSESAVSVEKAYWGSIAIFEKDIFTLSEADYMIALEIWKSFRLKNDQISSIADYEKGFRKGYNEPPALVDGSASYNLGHSDGMQAKQGKILE